TWRCSLATVRQARVQSLDRFVHRETWRCLRRSSFWAARNHRGLSTISASLVTAKASTPTSMPMASWFSGKGSLSRIEEKQAYHLPFSFLRVSVLTSPWSERCNLILTLPILDNDSCPPFTANPAWGYVNESNQPWPLKRGNPRPRRKNAWYVLIYTVQHILQHCEYTLPSARQNHALYPQP